MAALKDLSTAELEQRKRNLDRHIAAKESRDDLLRYMRFVQPDPEDIENEARSAYVATPLARLLCDVYKKVEQGKLMRVAISTGPQLGKSQVVSRDGITWFSGRNPTKHIMLGAYNSDFAAEFGGDVRNRIMSITHQQVFPEHGLMKSAKSRDYMITTAGGKLAFVGVGGSGTGKPADLFVVDDPIRNDEDAQSAAYRDKVWSWFNKVVFTRCHSGTPVIVCLTRWHEDDLIGRLVDPDHPERNGRYAGIADKWTYLNLPTVVTDPDQAKALDLKLEVPTDPLVISQFGDQPMTSLWPARKGLPFLAEARQQDSRGFDALYMGKPSPEDGSYFTKDMIREYGRNDLPKSLRIYAASDHAVTKKQRNDATVLGCVGVDEFDNIWVMDDVWWKRELTDKVVEAMLAQMKKHNPLLWWAASDHISKSFGPFLRKRMLEEGIYIHLAESPEQGDKEQKAQAIKGRMAMGKVFFPRYAPWWRAARAEILKFPFGAHDDFVDFLSHIGKGLSRQVSARSPSTIKKIPEVGTFAWMKWASKRREIAGKKSLRGQ
jgi:predicted phage terminase large subunit-like protein